MIVKYSSKWLPYLKEISDNSFPYPAIVWPNLGRYWVKMHFSSDPVTDTFAKPDGFYVLNQQKDAMQILKLCVHPLCRGKGAGSNLLHDIELAAIAVQSLVVINVHEMDLCTIYWLQKRGYKAVRVERNLFSDGRDGYSFCKGVK